MPAEYGVPQGSKLGPILYIIYANEMINLLKNSNAFAYADDTAIVVSHKCINTATHLMQNELNIISRWCHDNGLIINAAKTKLMHIKPRHFTHTNINIIFHSTDCLHNTTNNCYNACSTIIEQVDTYKYLGVHLDHNFKWKPHIENVMSKLRKASYALFHLSNCCTYSVLRQAYFSLVESYIRHGITAWGNATYCRLLQQNQNRILKILIKNKNHASNNTNQIGSNNENTTQSTQNICKELNILNIKNLYNTTIINEFYDDTTYLKNIDHQINTRMRAEGRYQVPSYKNNYGKNSIAVSLPSIMNALPINLLNLRNNPRRKNLIKNHFLHSQ